jgi:hypothetical protein
MERQAEIEEALKIFRDYSRKIGKKRSRTHDETADKQLAERRALKGICGRCEHLQIIKKESPHSKGVSLSCSVGENPIGLYLDTPLGEKAECEFFTPTTSASAL